MSEWLSWIWLGVAVLGSLYALSAAIAVRKFARRPVVPARRFPSISILKPMRGAEPGLYEALASFCMQDYPAPVQILFGASRADDPCVPVVRKLIGDFPASDLELIIDGKTHGANGKVSSLANLTRRIRHELVIVSDGDIQVQPDYLRGVVSAFVDEDVGLVTCLYRGVPQAGVWAQLSAMAIDYDFLPGVLVGAALRLAHPGFGSTIALQRETLDRIGGFSRFADQLANDHAIGAAVRATGLNIAIAAPVVSHLCTERTARDLIRHELRRARTARAIHPIGFAGSVVMHPLPFALLFAAFTGFPLPGWIAIAAALACRLLVLRTVDRSMPGVAHARWLLPLRDLLSFAVFVSSFFVAVVSWRGQRYRVLPDGTLSRVNDTAP
jgi:ceramide glucosyltransferase